MASSTVEPIHVDVLQVLETHLAEAQGVLSIDKGCSLTKVLYISTDQADCASDKRRVICETYLGMHSFEDIFESLRTKPGVPWDAMTKQNVLRLTGAGCDFYAGIIEKNTGVKPEIIDEFFSHTSGTVKILKWYNDEELIYPNDEPVVLPNIFTDESSGLMQKFLETMKKQVPAEALAIEAEQRLPCVLAFLGSGGGFTRLEENGESKLIGGVHLCGKSFIGLARLLLNTRNYDEIADLAQKGDRRKVDTQIKEVLSNTSGSKYGNYKDVEHPIFSFGKAVDYDKGLEDFAVEDIAASLVDAYIGNMVTACLSTLRGERLRKIYIGGNMFRSAYFRNQFKTMWTFFNLGFYEVRFFRTGHTAALGALLAEAGKENSIW